MLDDGLESDIPVDLNDIVEGLENAEGETLSAPLTACDELGILRYVTQFYVETTKKGGGKIITSRLIFRFGDAVNV
jgi:hypothetical protein